MSSWVERIEIAIDAGSSALFGAAVGFAADKFGSVGMIDAATGAAAIVGCFAVLRAVKPEHRGFALADFAAAPIAAAEVEELVLTDADRLDAANRQEIFQADELLLDDVLAELAPESRVVRLFDPSAMPTPEQLKARIDRHLNGASAPLADASQALHDALAELRRSLR